VGLWRDILEARYGNWRNMNVTLIHRKQSLWWKDLYKTSGRETQGNWFDCRTQWLLADGRSVKFWEDRWVDGQVLKEKFPRLFTISQCKDSTMRELVVPGQIRSGGCQSWNLGWRRERFEWEKHLEAQLMETISSVKWIMEGNDRLKWVDNDQQEYFVKSGYRVLNKEELMQMSEEFQVLWSLIITPSVAVCAWRLLLDRLPTRDNLARRGMQLTSVRCPMCQEGEETAQHLFTTCKVAQKVCDLYERWVGNVPVRHNAITIHFQSFHLVSQSQRVNRAWKGIWVAIVSEIRKHKNNVVFKRGVVDHEEIFCSA